MNLIHPKWPWISWIGSKQIWILGSRDLPIQWTIFVIWILVLTWLKQKAKNIGLSQRLYRKTCLFALEWDVVMSHVWLGLIGANLPLRTENLCPQEQKLVMSRRRSGSVDILDQFIILYSRNLPYCICFWGTPLPSPTADIICTCPLSLLHSVSAS